MSSQSNVVRFATYNCRGWSSSIPFGATLLHTCDIVLIQEHWLFRENLNSLNIDSQFIHHGVSGMDSATLLAGRPYGGCAFLIRKSLVSHICQVNFNSQRLCAIKIVNNDFITLVVNVYYLQTMALLNQMIHILRLLQN